MIAHSSFCNESVVISHGIVDAKIRLLIYFPNKMTGKDKLLQRKQRIAHG